jgi:hypothetical protein
MEHIKPLIETWNKYHKEVYAFQQVGGPWHNDVQHAIENIKAYSNFLKENYNTFNTWMMNYLEINRNKIFLRYWVEHGNAKVESILENRFSIHLHPSFNTECSTYIPQVSFTRAFEESSWAVAHFDSSNCDDPEILAIHESSQGVRKTCHGDGWGCWDCEDMQYKWRDKLIKQVLEINNVFANKKLHQKFIEETEINLPNTWMPPKIYEKKNKYNYNEQNIYNKDEFCSYIKEKREKDYNKADLEDKKYVMTTRQFLDKMTWNIYCTWKVCEKYDDPYNIFISLWNLLDVLPFLLELEMDYLHRAEELWTPSSSSIPFRRSTAAVR